MVQNGCFYVKYFKFMYVKHCFLGIYVMFDFVVFETV